MSRGTSSVQARVINTLRYKGQYNDGPDNLKSNPVKHAYYSYE